MMTAALLLLLMLQDRVAPPSDADQAAALKLIKDVFKADLAKKTPADQKLLAKKMLDQGRETKDDATTQYVLLLQSRDLSNLAGDLTSALEAIDELGKRFTVDAAAMRTAALLSTSKVAKSPEDFAAAAAAAIKIADGAIARDEFDAADKVLASGIAMAKKAQDAALAARVTAKQKEAADLRTRFNAVRRAREVLEKTPDDAASNAAVGRYQVLLKGNWAEGLPLLAKGSDETLRGLAASDLGNPADPSAQAQLGDGWWDLSDKETASKDLLRERAVSWYVKALPKLAGLSKTKAEKRLQEFNTARLARGNWLNCTDAKNFDWNGRAGETIDVPCKPGFQSPVIAKEFPKGKFDAVTIHLIQDPVTKGGAFIYLDSFRTCALVDCNAGSVGFGVRPGSVVPWQPVNEQKIEHSEDCTVTVVISGGEFILYVDAMEKTRLKTSTTLIKDLTVYIVNGNASISNWKLRRAE
jgi:hypothetical protein